MKKWKKGKLGDKNSLEAWEKKPRKSGRNKVEKWKNRKVARRSVRQNW